MTPHATPHRAPPGSAGGAFPPPKPVSLFRFLMRILGLVAAGAALALVASSAWWAVPALRCGGPVGAIRSVDGQCVGVTDGSFEFSDDFAGIQDDIRAENERVARMVAEEGAAAVKVALLAPLTPVESGPISPGQVRSLLEGAYVGVYRANRTNEFGDKKPLIQLYLANEGSRQLQWRYPVSRIEDMTDDDIPLVAVMGQALSTTRTQQAAERLSDRGIAMVTATATGDGLDHGGVPGLLRASPSNTDFAAALDRYLTGRDDLESGIMVYDRVQEDLFVSTLRAAYQRRLGDHFDFPHQGFSGASVVDGGADVFFPIRQTICTARPDMVAFAGRATDLRTFLNVLSERVCNADPVSVLFAETGRYPWSDEDLAMLQEGNITILNATSADPRWAEPGDQGEPAGYADFHERYRGLVSRDPQKLENGYAVAFHDAMAVTVRAVRIADPFGDGPPTLREVRDHLLLLNERHTVRAATGTLSFSSERDGNPGGKHVPVVPVPFSEEAADDAPYVTADPS
ncbi:ABC transporter substrate-binding protein [Streptomonospora salina]|uniref:Leucine-binding protein domain-containing protein n=1 Tax=Streptomonospora salina TaxID=104205 RepID=A0A841E975_9ACTN|nr:ABC transporter substrate-binding protein [Streptomonospora salina]MBB5999512.1 hypothetical protein [Streptomonospora salina]